MEHNDFFNNALSNFAFDVASGSAICHLADKGCSVCQIRERLDFPVSCEKVQQTVWKHFIEQHVVLLDEPGKSEPKEKETYVIDYGKYGRKSIRQVTEPNAAYRQISWSQIHYNRHTHGHFPKFLSEKRVTNGEDTSYVSCDFGMMRRKEPENYKALLKLLDGRQKDYIEGLPWPESLVFHRLNDRMTDIICVLQSSGTYSAVCYFMESGEKIIF